jgi:hypothetical protein
VASAFWGEHLKKKFGRFVEWLRQGKLGTDSHLFMEDVDRFSRMSRERTWPLITKLSAHRVKMHFIWDNLIYEFVVFETVIALLPEDSR